MKNLRIKSDTLASFTNTPISIGEASHRPIHQQELLITGRKRVDLKSFDYKKEEIILSDTFGNYSVINQSLRKNFDKFSISSQFAGGKGILGKGIMVRKKFFLC